MFIGNKWVKVTDLCAMALRIRHLHCIQEVGSLFAEVTSLLMARRSVVTGISGL